MRKQLAVIALLALAGVISLLVTGAQIKRSDSFSLGVSPGAPVAQVRAGQTVCQGPIDVSSDFGRITLVLGTFKRPGPPLDVTVRDAAGKAVLTSGHLAGGYADNGEQQVNVGPVRHGAAIKVCAVNRGRHSVALYGAGDAAHAPSSATVNGTAQHVDVSVRFLYDHPRSLLSLAPEMIDRATLFAAVDGWVLWLLFGLLACGAPALLTYALARAADDSPPPGD